MDKRHGFAEVCLWTLRTPGALPNLAASPNARTIDCDQCAEPNAPLPCGLCGPNLRLKPSLWLSLRRWRKAVLSETPSKSTMRCWYGRMKLAVGGTKNLPQTSKPAAAALRHREVEIAITTQSRSPLIDANARPTSPKPPLTFAAQALQRHEIALS